MTAAFIVIFEILITFFESYIKYLFVHVFLSKDKKVARPVLIASILETAIITYLNGSQIFSYYTIFAAIVITCIFSIFVFKTNKVNILSVFAISTTYYFMTEIIAFLYLSIVSAILNNSDFANYIVSRFSFARIVFIIVVKLIVFAIYLCIRNYFYNVFKTTFSTLVILGISLFGIIGTFYLTSNSLQNMDNNVILNWIFYLFIIILLFSSFLSYSRYRDEIEKQHRMKIQKLIWEKSYEELQKNYNQNAKVYHDLDNNLSVLYNLIQIERYDEASRYIDEISSPIRNLHDNIITGNSSIDFVLNYKSKQAAQQNIKVHFSADFAPSVKINVEDLCTVLFNLLDNAIEACEKLDSNKDRWITLTMCPIDNMYVIKIKNPCQLEDMKTSDALLETTKKNKLLHGWGIQNILDTVEKYEGIAQIIVENKIFCFTTMFF